MEDMERTCWLLISSAFGLIGYLFGKTDAGFWAFYSGIILAVALVRLVYQSIGLL